MQLPTTALLLALLTPLTTALPSGPSPSITRYIPCGTVPLNNAARINLVKQPDQDSTNQTVSFFMPRSVDPSALCTLRARFPPHWEVYDSQLEAGGQPLTVAVYAVVSPTVPIRYTTGDGPGLTMNDQDGPVAGKLLGKAQFAGGDQDTARVVGVFGNVRCQEKMTYRLEIAEGTGELGFVNGLDKGLKVSGGLEMEYSCNMTPW